MITITIASSTDSQTIEFSDLDEKVLLDMVPSIFSWMAQGPLSEKLANHRNRIIRFMTDEFVKGNVQTLPQDRDAIVSAYFDRENYLNRAQRDTANTNGTPVIPVAI